MECVYHTIVNVILKFTIPEFNLVVPMRASFHHILDYTRKSSLDFKGLNFLSKQKVQRKFLP